MTLMPIAFKARWVLPVDRPPIDGGVVTIEGDRIVAVGSARTCPKPTHDLGDVVLLPGLVNAHTHFEFSHLQRPLGQPGMSLPEWIPGVIADRNRTGRNVAAALAEGLQECLRQGVTTLGEIATSPQNLYPGGATPHLTAFQEVIGFSAARTESVLADVRQRLGKASDGASRWRAIGLSPHAPYTVHPGLLKRLVDFACEKSIPVAMHLAESPEELQLLEESTGPFRELLEQRSMWDADAIAPGTRPMDYLQVLAQAPRSLVIHGNYLQADEIAWVAQQRERMSVVFCPRTHAYFDHAPYPLSQMMAGGARVALGTDSRASNPDLSLLGEMRFLAKHHADISGHEIVRMGTLSGAEALGLADVVGSITPGKWANLTAVPCRAGCDEPYEAILQGDQPPVWTCLRGKLTW